MSGILKEKGLSTLLASSSSNPQTALKMLWWYEDAAQFSYRALLNYLCDNKFLTNALTLKFDLNILDAMCFYRLRHKFDGFTQIFHPVKQFCPRDIVFSI